MKKTGIKKLYNLFLKKKNLLKNKKKAAEIIKKYYGYNKNENINVINMGDQSMPINKLIDLIIELTKPKQKKIKHKLENKEIETPPRKQQIQQPITTPIIIQQQPSSSSTQTQEIQKLYIQEEDRKRQKELDEIKNASRDERIKREFEIMNEKLLDKSRDIDKTREDINKDLLNISRKSEESFNILQNNLLDQSRKTEDINRDFEKKIMEGYSMIDQERKKTLEQMRIQSKTQELKTEEALKRDRIENTNQQQKLKEEFENKLNRINLKQQELERENNSLNDRLNLLLEENEKKEEIKFTGEETVKKDKKEKDENNYKKINLEIIKIKDNLIRNNSKIEEFEFKKNELENKLNESIKNIPTIVKSEFIGQKPSFIEEIIRDPLFSHIKNKEENILDQEREIDKGKAPASFLDREINEEAPIPTPNPIELIRTTNLNDDFNNFISGRTDLDIKQDLGLIDKRLNKKQLIKELENIYGEEENLPADVKELLSSINKFSMQHMNISPNSDYYKVSKLLFLLKQKLPKKYDEIIESIDKEGRKQATSRPLKKSI